MHQEKESGKLIALRADSSTGAGADALMTGVATEVPVSPSMPEQEESVAHGEIVERRAPSSPEDKKTQASEVLGRTTSWSPKSQCVYGPENEIAAVTFFCEKWRSFNKKQYFCKCNGMAGFRGTRLLIEGL